MLLFVTNALNNVPFREGDFHPLILIPVSSVGFANNKCRDALHLQAFCFPASGPITLVMSQHSFGWFGWFSAAGFIILGLLYLLDMYFANVWEFSAWWTLIVAIVAGIGALALYYGNDSTDDTVTTEQTT